MNRQLLEKYQVFIYLAAIGCGLMVGAAMPDRIEILEIVLWPILGVLLYTIFIQVPLVRVGKAFSDFRFMMAAVIGNFVLLPLVVWGLMAVVPDDPGVRLGVLLVLLMPCTDWFISFTHLGGGDTRRAIAFSPVSLLLQIILLPVYVWMFFGPDFMVGLAQREMFAAFVGLIIVPLLAAVITEAWFKNSPARAGLPARLAWFPVPLLAVVVFSIAATQVGVVLDSIGLLGHLLLVFAAFLVIAALLALVLARPLGLPASQGRALAFSFGTRNSFVVLPMALALPASFELAVIAVVFQSLVELFGMAVYLWWVPRRLFPQPREHPV